MFDFLFVSVSLLIGAIYVVFVLVPALIYCFIIEWLNK
jgi:hypothetical protein